MKRVAIEARALSMAGGGVKTYVRELTRALLRDEGVDWRLILADESALDTFKSGEVVPMRHPLLLSWWLSRQVPRTLAQLRPDVVHFTKADVPARKIWPTVVTVYDVIPLLLPQTQSPIRQLYWKKALQRACAQSDHIITISEASKRDIQRFFEVPEERITVTPLVVDTEFFQPREDAAVLRDALGIQGPYVLFLGTRDLRKNVAALLKAFANIAETVPHTLVIGGGRAFKEDSSEQLVQQLGIGDRVRFLDFVPQEHLPALYSGADLFVWPSLYEGWGFPVQEAMACGTPVMVSNGGPLPEIVGKAGEVVPFSTDDLNGRFDDEGFVRTLAERMAHVLQDKGRRQEMRELGLAQVRRRSWAEVAAETTEVYKRVSQ